MLSKENWTHFSKKAQVPTINFSLSSPHCQIILGGALAPNWKRTRLVGIYLCTKGHRVHNNGILADFEYAFLSLIDHFRKPRWKENRPEI